MDDQRNFESSDVLGGGIAGRADTEKKQTRQQRRTRQDTIERAIVREVAPRLAASIGGDGRTQPADADDLSAEALLALLLKGDRSAIRDYTFKIEQGELSLTEACQRVFIPVAESLGTMWCDDSLSFVDVTLALSRLQYLVQDFAAQRGTQTSRPPPERRIMLARAPGEDHVFGLVVLGLYFDSAGWEVSGGTDVEAGEVLYRELKSHDYRVLGLSVGSQANTAELGRIVCDARKSSRNPHLKIAVGGAAIRADSSLCKRIGADFFAEDANEAIEKAESLVA